MNGITTLDLAPRLSLRCPLHAGVAIAAAIVIVPNIAVAQTNSSLLDFAVYATGTGCAAINLSGKAYIDSFDSSRGSYAQTRQLSQAIVGVSGNISLSGQATINGPIFALNTTAGSCANGTPGISLSGKAVATGSYIKLTAVPPLPAPTPVNPGAQDYALTADTSLPPGSYKNISVSGGKTLTLSPGIYNINSLTLSGQSIVTVNPAGQVIINVAGNNVSQPIQITGGASILNASGKPLTVQLIYGGNLPIALSGGTMSHALLYAPNSAVTLNGGSDWFGALAVKTLDAAGDVALHYDRSLAVPPTITSLVSPAPSPAGWNNSNATVTFTCADSILGIASCTAPVQFTAEGANQAANGTAANRAGFSASLAVNVNLDKTSPVITAAASPAPNAAGWNNSNVTVSFACTDALSGIGSCSPPASVTSDTASQVVQGTATDKAGNTAFAAATVKLDKTPPTLTLASPANGATVYTSPIAVTGTVSDALSGLAAITCNGTPAKVTGNSFTCGITLTLGANSIVVRATDIAGNSSNSPFTVTYLPAPTVSFTSPANLSYLNLSPTTVTGTVSDASATLTINSIAVPVANGAFSATIPLAEGPNTLTASAKSAAGAVGTNSIQVTLDTTPPHVTITSPPDQFITTDASISVAGGVNDIVVGTVNSQQAQVTVNGLAAAVANRTFLAANVPLNIGTNVIQAVGRDRAGNAATTQITITRQAVTQPQIRLLSGNNQTGVINSLLAAPLVAALTDAAGNPIPNKQVIFKVTQNNGLVNAAGAPGTSAVATTNSQGQAQAQWSLGARAGAGGNSVQAYVVGFAGTAIFTATGTLGPAGKIVIDTGNSQVGEVNQPLPKPLIAVVVDSGNNRLANVPVTFTVQQGGGSFAGQPSFTVNTDSDGRVAATLTLGFQEGNANNLVQATFPNNQAFPASFTASGRAPGNPVNTTISGLVLDNSNLPLPGVTVRGVLTNLLNSNSSIVQSAATAVSDAKGQFTIAQAPVGFVKLLVDGSTAQKAGNYPTLDYDVTTIAGQNNSVGQPIYLLPLNSNNQLCVTPTTGGGTLTMPEAPGFSLTFGPGQVTFPGGSKSGCVSVTVVHGDKIPMVPGFGQQPRFIVTIQPAGAAFNPPAPITLPNVDGLKPRQVTEMYSFDHDIGSFVAIGTGIVSDDGRIIRSSTGVGVLKAGWHCGGDPNAIGIVADCPVCESCVGVVPPNSLPGTVPGICVPEQICDDMNSRCPSGQACDGQGACKDGRSLLASLGTKIDLNYVPIGTTAGGPSGTCSATADYSVTGLALWPCKADPPIGAALKEKISVSFTDCFIGTPKFHYETGTGTLQRDMTFGPSFTDHYGLDSNPLSSLIRGQCTLQIDQVIYLDGVKIDEAFISMRLTITDTGCSISGAPSRRVLY